MCFKSPPAQSSIQALQPEKPTTQPAKEPGSAAAEARRKQAANSGEGGTMLTGAAGVPDTSLTLGKSTLLGGM